MKDRNSFAADLEKLRGSSLASLIRAQIEGDIISGHWRGGDHLPEQELTAFMGVSRGPVREALRALEGQGLLEQKKNRGWFVRHLNADEIEEVFEMRAILDHGLAPLLIARRGTHSFAESQKELQKLIDLMDDAARDGRRGDYARLNQSFHDILLAISGNDHLTRAYRNMMGELASHVVGSLELEGAMEASNRDHRDIAATLHHGDLEQLCEVFRAHRQGTLRRMSLTSQTR